MIQEALEEHRVLRDEFDKGDYNYEIEVAVIVESNPSTGEPCLRVESSKVKRFHIKHRTPYGW